MDPQQPPGIPALKVPVASQPIWRYMSFAKFLALLDASALFFPYVGNFHDALDGRPNGGAASAAAPSAFVNSWHMSEHESEAMWRLFSPVEEAIAVRSTYARLRSQLPESSVKIYQVEYTDSPPLEHPSPTPIHALFYKRSAFEHEKELRAVLIGPANADSPWHSGRMVRVNVEVLVECVLVSPLASEWFVQLVGRVARKYGLKRPIAPSGLAGTLSS